MRPLPAASPAAPGRSLGRSWTQARAYLDPGERAGRRRRPAGGEGRPVETAGRPRMQAVAMLRPRTPSSHRTHTARGDAAAPLRPACSTFRARVPVGTFAPAGRPRRNRRPQRRQRPLGGGAPFCPPSHPPPREPLPARICACARVRQPRQPVPAGAGEVISTAAATRARDQAAARRSDSRDGAVCPLPAGSPTSFFYNTPAPALVPAFSAFLPIDPSPPSPRSRSPLSLPPVLPPSSSSPFPPTPLPLLSSHSRASRPLSSGCSIVDSD